MAYDNEAVLEASGFKKKGEVWHFKRDFVEGENARSAEIAVSFASDGTMTGTVGNLYYKSDDVADMVALAQNEVGLCLFEVTGNPSETGFEDEEQGLWITSPFNGDPYFDYDVVGKDPDGKWQLKNPVENYPKYDEWKAELVEQLMNTSSPKP